MGKARYNPYDPGNEGVLFLNLDYTSNIPSCKQVSLLNELRPMRSVLGFEYRSLRQVEKYMNIQDPDVLQYMLLSTPVIAQRWNRVYGEIGGARANPPHIARIIEFLLWERAIRDLSVRNALLDIGAKLDIHTTIRLVCIHGGLNGVVFLEHTNWYPRVVRNVIACLRNKEPPTLENPIRDTKDAWLTNLATTKDSTETLINKVYDAPSVV